MARRMNLRYSGLYMMGLLFFWHHYIRPVSDTIMRDADLVYAVQVREEMLVDDLCHLTGCLDSGLV